MNEQRIGLPRLRDLEVFVQVVDSASMTAAAAALGMSTAAVSRSVAALEQRLRLRLIDRSSRLLVLSTEGRELHARASRLLDDWRELETALQARPDELVGTLRISVPTAGVEMGMVRDFVELLAKHAKLSIEISLSDQPVDVVARGLDAALYLTDAPDRHPGDLILGRHPTALAAAPVYLERAGLPGEPQALLLHRTVRAVSRRGTPSPWWLQHRDGQTAEVAAIGSMLLTSDLRVAYTAVANGAGIGRMPLAYIARGQQRGDLARVLPDWQFRPVVLAAVVRRRGTRSRKLQAVFDLSAAAIQRLDEMLGGESNGTMGF